MGPRRAGGPVRRVGLQPPQRRGDGGRSAGGTTTPNPVCVTGWRTPGMSLEMTGTPACMATPCTIPNASNALTDGSANTSREE